VSAALPEAVPASKVGAPAIEARGLVKQYGGRAVLDGVDLAVRPGEIVALLGPNGAGKTTTIEIVEGYRRPDDGVVRVLGADPITGGPALHARVGLMLQGGGLDPRSTPREVLRLYAAFHDGAREPDGLLREVGLGEGVARTRIRRLSGGERQRLALALALVGEPEVLLLDEPTAGMDPEAKAATRALVAGLRDAGRAILLTTHDLGDVERLADRVVILAGGRVVAKGTPAELTAGAMPALRLRLASPLGGAAAALTAELRRTWPEAALELAPGDPTAMTISGAAPEPWLTAAVASWAAANDVSIVELRARSATLEERYLELTGDHAG
jgi:ABC-2 type transport system ATP-binding protein